MVGVYQSHGTSTPVGRCRRQSNRSAASLASQHAPSSSTKSMTRPTPRAGRPALEAVFSGLWILLKHDFYHENTIKRR